MTRVLEAYPNLIGGVSQQDEINRIPGQHTEQINMLSDQAAGLTRRHGTILRSKLLLGQGPGDFSWREMPQAVTDYLASFRTAEWNTGGKEMDISYPTLPRPPEAAGWVIPDDLVVYNWTDRKIMPWTASGEGMTEAFNAGFATCTQMGKYFVMVPNGHVTRKQAYVDTWLSQANLNRGTVWIKSGNYATNYGFTFEWTPGPGQNNDYQGSPLPNGNRIITCVLLTPATVSDAKLDFSDIAPGDDFYIERVNSRTNQFNANALNHTAQAAQAVKPSEIMKSLHRWLLIEGKMWYYWFELAGNYLGVNIPGLQSIKVWSHSTDRDIGIAHKTVKDGAELPGAHWPGNILEVRPSVSSPPYYVMAHARSEGLNQFYQDVLWKETTRTHFNEPADRALALREFAKAKWIGILLNLHSNGQDMYRAWNGMRLREFMGESEVRLPTTMTRLVGDEDTSPDPSWMGRQITCMKMFQDRLLIYTGDVGSGSEVGNYLNFYRTTTLTVRDTDPIRLSCAGSEGDTIRHGEFYGDNLVLFGDRFQYKLDGTRALTPVLPIMGRAGAVSGTTVAQPRVSGNNLFFTKFIDGVTRVGQVSLRDVGDVTSYDPLDGQLTDYIAGKPCEILCLHHPGTVLVRTRDKPYSLYVYRYFEQDRKRVMSSWSRFDYGPEFGRIIGMSSRDEEVILFVLRDAAIGGTTRIPIPLVQEEVQPLPVTPDPAPPVPDAPDARYTYVDETLAPPSRLLPVYATTLDGTNPSETTPLWSTEPEGTYGDYNQKCLTSLVFRGNSTIQMPVQRPPDEYWDRGNPIRREGPRFIGKAADGTVLWTSYMDFAVPRGAYPTGMNPNVLEAKALRLITPSGSSAAVAVEFINGTRDYDRITDSTGAVLPNVVVPNTYRRAGIFPDLNATEAFPFRCTFRFSEAVATDGPILMAVTWDRPVQRVTREMFKAKKADGSDAGGTFGWPKPGLDATTWILTYTPPRGLDGVSLTIVPVAWGSRLSGVSGDLWGSWGIQTRDEYGQYLPSGSLRAVPEAGVSPPLAVTTAPTSTPIDTGTTVTLPNSGIPGGIPPTPEASSDDGKGVFLVVESQSLSAKLSTLPYLDSLRPAAMYLTGPGRDLAYKPSACLAMPAMHGPKDTVFFTGEHPAPTDTVAYKEFVARFGSSRAEEAYVGLPYTSEVVLTSPIRYDRNGRPRMGYKFIIQRLVIENQETSAFQVRVSTDWKDSLTLSYNGRFIGRPNNIADWPPAWSHEMTADINNDTKEYKATISSVLWAPMNITSVGYIGNWLERK